MLAALRSTLFIAWMAVTVVPQALAVMLSSTFIRGDALYRICVAWPRKSLLLRPGVIDISIRMPIPSIGREAEELMREIESWVEAEMRRHAPDAYAS